MVKIFVGRIPESIGSEKLREIFTKYGKVTECEKIKDYGFVHMDSESCADTAIAALHQTKIDGGTLTVEKSHGRPSAKVREENGAGRDRGGRSGGGGPGRRDSDRRGGSSGGGYRDRQRSPVERNRYDSWANQPSNGSGGGYGGGGYSGGGGRGDSDRYGAPPSHGGGGGGGHGGGGGYNGHGGGYSAAAPVYSGRTGDPGALYGDRGSDRYSDRNGGVRGAPLPPSAVPYYERNAAPSATAYSYYTQPTRRTSPLPPVYPSRTAPGGYSQSYGGGSNGTSGGYGGHGGGGGQGGGGGGGGQSSGGYDNYNRYSSSATNYARPSDSSTGRYSDRMGAPAAGVTRRY